MARPLSRWRKADLREIRNWRALVSNWRHGLVDWVLDYLTDPKAHSIYRLRGCWRLEGKKVTGAQA